MRIVPIIVFFTGHCGSSWFVDLLGRQPWCVRLGFEPIDQACRRPTATPLDEYLRELLQLNPNATSHHYFQGGAFTPQSRFKETTTHFCLKTRILTDQPSIFGKVLPQSGAHFLHIRRRNKIAAAVSNYKRERLGISHVKNDMPIQDKRVPTYVDVRFVGQKAKQFLMREALIERYKQRLGRDVHTLWYEDLLNNLDSTLAAVALHIGAEFQGASSTFQKMTHPDLAKSIKNYDELQKYLRSAGLAELLASQDAEPAFVKDILARSEHWLGLKMRYIFRQKLRKIDKMFA